MEHPVSIIREFPSREWPRMVFVPTDDRAWHQRFSFRSRREKKGKLLRTGRDEVLPNHTNHIKTGKTGTGRFWSSTPGDEPVQGGKTFCAGFCASLIAGSRRAFLCVDYVCLLLEFWMKCTRCERLLPVKHFYLKCLLFFVAWKLLWIQNNQC